MKNTNNKAEAAPAQCGQHTQSKFFPVRIGGKIFIATTPAGFEGGSLQVAEIIKWKNASRTRAHTSLLAAAPDLLEALKDLAGEVSVLCHPGEDYERTPLAESWSCAMEVIEKAQGSK